MTTTLSEQAALPRPVDPETLHHVRAAVKEILTNSPVYMAMPQEVKRDIAHDMVNVGTYLIDGEGSPAKQRAQALADPPPPPPPDTAGADFAGQGGAVAGVAGTQAYTEQIQRVSFPKFVGELIQGTFGAIVTASIQQMDAYANLLKNVTKSVDQYMQENVTKNNARDYLAQQYPEHLQVDTTGGEPKLVPKDGADEQALPDFVKDLGLPAPIDSLDEETVEQTLVPAARERMAMDRQHLLATMVLMGINRLVVTDGDIEAKVLFTLATRDSVTRDKTKTASFHDEYKYHHEEGASSGFLGLWSSPPSVTEDYSSTFDVTTTKHDSSAAEVNMHTNLSGKVALRFKSETFPLDRMADIIGVDNVGGQQVGSGAVRAPARGTPAGPPPLAPQTLTPPATPGP
jgi:hypothetical protein